MSKVSICTCGQSDPQGATASRNDEGNHACFCMVKAICGSDTQGRIQKQKNSGTQLNSFFNLQLSWDFQFIINGEKIKRGAPEVSIGFHRFCGCREDPPLRIRHMDKERLLLCTLRRAESWNNRSIRTCRTIFRDTHA